MNSFLVNPPCWVQKIFNNKLEWSIDTSNKEIFLTFDDGPTTELTPWILDTLKEYNATATFFCVGSNLLKHPQLKQQILEAGHNIGNHTMNHEVGLKTKTADYIKSIVECQKLVGNTLFRPPHGKITPHQIKVLSQHFRIIMWSTLTYDFDKTISPGQCYQNSIAKTKAGSIVVFHDNIKAQENIKFALPRFLDYYIKKGFYIKRLEVN